jgi:hypothetical protein
MTVTEGAWVRDTQSRSPYLHLVAEAHESGRTYMTACNRSRFRRVSRAVSDGERPCGKCQQSAGGGS